ncbi:MAG: cation diffusion facilitator family transporter [Streptosporangiales bacterium]
MADQGGESTGTVLLALAMNALIAIVKGIGGFLTGSSALLSEAGHSVSDTMNQAFLFIALKRSSKPPDEQHPFGYGQERFFWALIAAVGIFAAGAMFSFLETYLALTESGSEEAFGFYVSYIVLGIALIAESASLAKAVRQTRKEASAAGRGLVEHIRKSDDPTVKTVASEDTAAVTGVVIAFIGIALHQLTGNGVFEGIASFLIGVLLTYVAFALARDNKDLLIGEAADPRLRKQMTDHLASYAEIDAVAALYTMHLGTRRLLVAARLDLASTLSSDQVEDISTRIDRDMRERWPEVEQVFLDATDTSGRTRSDGVPGGTHG